MNRWNPLEQLKYQVISPLQEAWQAAKIIKRYPQLEPVIKAYQALYPYAGASTSVSVNEREARGIDDDTLTYGETRWTTFMELLPQLTVSSDDRFIDLGCGTGFLCFMMHAIYGIPATGVDLIQGFIDNAEQVRQQLNWSQPRFQQADFFSLSFLPFSLIYATCTCFPEDVMDQLADKLRETEPGTRILTVTDLPEGDHLRLIRRIPARYSWGPDHVYLSERI